MRALVTVESRRQFEVVKGAFKAIDGLGNVASAPIGLSVDPILKPGTPLVFGLADGTVVNEGIITGVLVRR